VLPVWEGTTNVLALDTLRALRAEGSFAAVVAEVARCGEGIRDAALAALADRAVRAVRGAGDWLQGQLARGDAGRAEIEAGARRFALTLGRATELALLAHHAQWSLEHEEDGRARAAARRLALHGVDLLEGFGRADRDEARALADDRPLAPARSDRSPQPVG
jgi:hypothetical protein